MIPVVVGILKAVPSIFTFGIGAHHKKAVAKENNVLGASQPRFEQALDDAVDQFTAGMIDAATAKGKIDQALERFKSDTASIRKMEGKAGETGDPWAGGKCNAACVILHQYTKTANRVKTQIDAQSGGKPGATGVPQDRRQSGGSPGRGGGAKPSGGSPFLASVLPGLNPDNKAIILIAAILAVVFIFGFAVVRSSGR